MAISFPYTFANLSGNVPASDLDLNFTYTGTLPSQATTITAASYTLTGSETVLINASSTPYGATLTQIASVVGIGLAAGLGSGAQATPAQILAGTATAVAATPYSLAYNSVLSSNGSYALPGGLTIKWGFATCDGTGTANISFASSFTTSCYMVIGTAVVGTGDYGSYTVTIPTASQTTSGFTGYGTRGNSAYSGMTFFWLALGK